jgi:hypothetical protein
MNDKSDQDLDERLSRHFHSCLDGQLGRASMAFRHEMDVRSRWRSWTAAGAALAACLAVAWAFYGHRPAHKTDLAIAPPQVAPVDDAAVTPVVQSATWSRMVDDGAAVVDGQPVRQLRRKLVEEIEWYDAKDGAVVRQTVPQQQIFLIGMQTD